MCIRDRAAVANLRSGRLQEGLAKLRILSSLRPRGEFQEIQSVTQDWVEAWNLSIQPTGMELLRILGQLCGLDDWLLRTNLGDWYQGLVKSLVQEAEFDTFILSSSLIDRILETYLVLTFSHVEKNTSPEANPELKQLLTAKFRAFNSENKDLEAELLMGHLLPLKMTTEAGQILLRRSEMALLRGDRGLAIIDLLRAIESGGDCRLRAHLRLAEFLQTRRLEAATLHHLKKALDATNLHTEDLSFLCGRYCRLISRLSKSGNKVGLAIYEEHFRVLTGLSNDQLKPNLDLSWLRPDREPGDWPRMLELTLKLISCWQQADHDKPADWAFLEELLDRTVLCHGQLSSAMLEELGRLLARALSTFDVQNRLRSNSLWNRFVGFLPALGKKKALDVLQRLFDFTLRTQNASREGQVEDFLRRLEEEKSILVHPR